VIDRLADSIITISEAAVIEALDGGKPYSGSGWNAGFRPDSGPTAVVKEGRESTPKPSLTGKRTGSSQPSVAVDRGPQAALMPVSFVVLSA
jgi:hypothetical protein